MAVAGVDIFGPYLTQAEALAVCGSSSSSSPIYDPTICYYEWSVAGNQWVYVGGGTAGDCNCTELTPMDLGFEEGQPAQVPCPECDVAPALTINPTLTPDSGPAALWVNYAANISGGKPPYSVSWSFEGGDPGGSLAESGSVIFNDEGPGRAWTVMITVTDDCGDTVSDTLGVTVGSGGCLWTWNGSSWDFTSQAEGCSCDTESPPGSPGMMPGDIQLTDCIAVDEE